MLDTIKLRNKYMEIQTELFYLIPEKWNKICLYASISNKINNLQTGEMYFYYFPKGLLKMKPVNVYEIPSKFNIDENQYLELVDRLYITIKGLRNEVKSENNKPWTNLTILIENNKFKIIFNYDDLIGSKYSSTDRHIIWRHEYLEEPIEVLNKKERKMLAQYYKENEYRESQMDVYSENIYKNSNSHNIIEYSKERAVFVKESTEVNKKVKQEVKKVVKEKNKKEEKIIIEKSKKIIESNKCVNQILKINY